jgi:hypothetical protein
MSNYSIQKIRASRYRFARYGLSNPRCVLFACFIFISCAASAQEDQKVKDSLLNIVSRINRIYPTVRPYSIQIDRVGDRVYNTSFLKQKIEKGEIAETFRAKSFVTFPSFKKRKFVLYGTFTHVYQKMSLRDAENLSANHPEFRSQRDVEMHDLTLSVNAVFKDSLFGRTAVYTSAIMLNSRNFKSVEKFRGLFTAAIVLKANQRTVITAGLIALIDPSANLPFTPLFTYWHRFPRQWQLDFILPSRLYLRHPFGSGWISVGTELSTAHGFNTPDQSILKGDYEISNILLQSGANLEYPVGKSLLLGFRTGVELTLASRLVKLNGKSTDYVSSTKADPSMFFNISLAYVPGLNRK